VEASVAERLEGGKSGADEVYIHALVAKELCSRRGKSAEVDERNETPTRVEVESDGVELLAHRLRMQVGQVGERREGRLDQQDVAGLVESVRCKRRRDSVKFGEMD